MRDHAHIVQQVAEAARQLYLGSKGPVADRDTLEVDALRRRQLGVACVDGVRASRYVFASIALSCHVQGVGALRGEELEELGESGEQVGTDGALVGGHALQRVLTEHEANTGLADRWICG